MEQKSNRAGARVAAYIFPLGVGLLCAACSQGPSEPRSGDKHPIALPIDRPSFSAAASDDRSGLGNDQGEDDDDDDETEDNDDEENEIAPHPGVAPGGEGGDDNDGSGGTDGIDSVSRVPAGTSLKDTDRDGIPDKYETNTGIFVDQSDTGTHPNNRDTDEDGIIDGDEVYGTKNGLDLPAFGVSPVHRDLLLEYDWIDDSEECGPHSHRPSAAALAPITVAFANAPVKNPDGVPGIHVIHDYGQGGVFTGGSLLMDVPTVIEGGADDSDFKGYMAFNMDENRVGYFHYALMGHRFHVSEDGVDYTDSSGVAQLPGSGFMVTLACESTDLTRKVGNTIMHELGHNLGLRHGGDTHVNDKPNYNSIMNYRYQFKGVDTDCRGGGDGFPDFSRNQRATLRESALNEQAGICNNVARDWNRNLRIDLLPVQADINKDGDSTGVLTDFDDWTEITGPKSLVTVRTGFVDSTKPPICPAPPTDDAVDEDDEDIIDGSGGADETGGTDDTGGAGETGGTDGY